MFLKNFCAFVGLSLFSGLSIAQGQDQAVQSDNGGIISRNPIDYATARFSRIVTAVRTDEEERPSRRRCSKHWLIAVRA